MKAIKMDNRKVMIYGAIAILGGLGIYALYNKYTKQKEYKSLMDDLEKDTNATGTIEDLRVTAFNSAFAVGKPANSLFTVAHIAQMATDIHDNIHGVPFVPFTSNPDRVVSLFSQFQTKAMVAQTAGAYNTKYNTDFLKDVESMDKDHVAMIKKMVTNLPDQK